MKRVLAALALAMAAAAGLLLASGMRRPTTAPPAAQYAGAQACMQCHADQFRAWQGSHHERAMQPLTPETALAPLRRENGRFLIETQGADGTPAAIEVSHTLGFYPLQQYLAPMPNGALHALSKAWDTRPAAEGGQRWLELANGAEPGDALHWTGRQNNWNFMCADCHTTGFRKNYDAQQRIYRSSWFANGVSCEACHGPAASHVAWAQGNLLRRLGDKQKGLALAATQRQGEQCVRCHAHRSQIDDAPFSGQPLLDTHVPSLLQPDLFWRDGQVKAEVFNHASFEQSRMHAKGVTCNSCHNPHTLKLRAPGNQLCLQCHAAPRFDTSAHHFHRLGSDGARCVNCHMPPSTFMQVDVRHDHGIRVPRPDLALRQGTPDACTKCHQDKDAAWAAKAAAHWYPGLPSRPAPLAAALHASDAGERDALLLLLALTTDPAQSSTVRATALALLPRHPDPQLGQRLCAAAQERDALLRKTAADALAELPAAQRTPCLRPLLRDPVKGVRIAAARWLAGVPQDDWQPAERQLLAQVTEEYAAVQRYNADRPESLNNLAMLYADQGELPRAEAALRQALQGAPDFPATPLNLAEVQRALGREAEAAQTLRAAAQRHPREAAVQFAMGLAEWRAGRKNEARAALARAAALAPQKQDYAEALRAAQ